MVIEKEKVNIYIEITYIEWQDTFLNKLLEIQGETGIES